MAQVPIAASPLSAANTNVVMVTCNSDVMHLTARINRVIFEMQHSQSSGIPNTIEPDRIRMEKYFGDIRKQVDGAFKRGIPDNPKTQPEQIVLSDVVEKPIENDDHKAVIDQLYILRDEVIGSASSRLGGGFLEPDYIRAVAMLDRVDDLFSMFIPAINPVDAPESTPSVPLSGHGNQGN